jgi:hypothetical protein
VKAIYFSSLPLAMMPLSTLPLATLPLSTMPLTTLPTSVDVTRPRHWPVGVNPSAGGPVNPIAQISQIRQPGTGNCQHATSLIPA